MKRIIPLLAFPICVVAAYAGLLDDVREEHARRSSARQVAELIASADVAELRGETDKESTSLVVRDAAWIQSVSRALRDVAVGDSVSCLCSGWQTVYFYRDGQLVARVAAIHGNQLRMFWGSGGGDFPVDEVSWRAAKAALEYRKKG
jgi:hypothetical protein